MQSIAIPAISSGEFKFSVQQSTKACLLGARLYFGHYQNTAIKEVYFVGNTELLYSAFLASWLEYVILHS